MTSIALPAIRLLICLSMATCVLSAATIGRCGSPPKDGKILFLGDSITYAGEYVNLLEAAWRIQLPNDKVDILNLGLPSETVSGLSEPGHAGGAFPRPGLHERLTRVLDQIHPEVVVACYGMNDGIYHPLSDDRFQAYQTGIKKLIQETSRRRIKLIILTPAFFDALPIKDRLLPGGQKEYPQPFVDYDSVLETYANWLLSLRSADLEVIDVHQAMKQAVLERRKNQPEFTFASDGVHPNTSGHRVIAETVAKEWGLQLEMDRENGTSKMSSVLPLISQRQNILKHAWLSVTKHQRPGIEPGLPVEQAIAKVSEIDARISEVLKKP